MEATHLPMIARNFTHHVPKDETVCRRHEAVREACKRAATELYSVAPDCRERSLAMTKLEEAMMWANAAIARNQ